MFIIMIAAWAESRILFQNLRQCYRVTLKRQNLLPFKVNLKHNCIKWTTIDYLTYLFIFSLWKNNEDISLEKNEKTSPTD